jgi:hypothetical protein
MIQRRRTLAPAGREEGDGFEGGDLVSRCASLLTVLVEVA